MCVIAHNNPPKKFLDCCRLRGAAACETLWGMCSVPARNRSGSGWQRHAGFCSRDLARSLTYGLQTCTTPQACRRTSFQRKLGVRRTWGDYWLLLVYDILDLWGDGMSIVFTTYPMGEHRSSGMIWTQQISTDAGMHFAIVDMAYYGRLGWWHVRPQCPGANCSWGHGAIPLIYQKTIYH